jgi:ABC-type transport system involved in cytochrome c biogenesis permease component
MKGIFQHLLLTLRLNFRARQALVYGYLVPIFFLIAFGSVFHSSIPPLLHEMGQLITITILGGACFGMPTTMVAERERGVWRRYRLLPGSTAALVISAMVARYLIILLAVIMQFALAWCLYRTPLPARPLSMLAAYTCVSFAFLGMGLIIAMLAGAVPAVQALGQAIFLPMIMIGGVGVPLRALPDWARHFAGYLPGRYAVELLDACYLPDGDGLAGGKFAIIALLVIGTASCIAGARIFRWDSGSKLPVSAKLWGLLALTAWAAVGLAAERAEPVNASPLIIGTGPWQNITPAEIAAVRQTKLPPIDGDIAPVDPNLSVVPSSQMAKVDKIKLALDTWPPGKVDELPQRILNLLSAAAVFDVEEDPNEGAVGYLVLNKIRQLAPPAQLEKILTYIAEHPSYGAVLTKVPELGVDGEITEQSARERCGMYATRLLQRMPPN